MPGVDAWLIGLETFIGHKGTRALAANVCSPGLAVYHGRLARAGCSHSFPMLKQHITLTMESEGVDDGLIENISRDLAVSPIKFKTSSVIIGDVR
jgi:hypothetical protein